MISGSVPKTVLEIAVDKTYVLVPNDINYNAPVSKKMDLQTAYLIIGHIYRKQFYNVHKEAQKGFVCITERSFMAIAENYSEYLDWLIASGYLLERGYGKRIYYKIKGAGYKSVPISNSVNRSYEVRKDLEYLFRYFNGLTIVDHNVDEVFDGATTEHNLRMAMSKNDIESKNISFKSNGYRLYTTVGMMKREQRTYLRYNGLKLIEVDMSNAMPFLATALFYKEPYKYFNIERVLSRCTKFEKLKSLLYRIHEAPPEDVTKYTDLVASGQLYDVVKPNPMTKRDRAKDIFLRTMFDRTRESDVLNLDKRFPHIKLVFDLIKTDFKKTNAEGRTRYEPGNLLCSVLNHVESTLFLKVIARKFCDAGAPAFTIHDGILTTEEFVPMLYDCISKETEKIFGLKPHVKIKHL